MRFVCGLLLLAASASAQVLEPGTVVKVAAPWSTPVTLVIPDQGTWRVEAEDPQGRPVEFLVQRPDTGGAWAVQGSSSLLGGGPALWAEVEAPGPVRWRIVPLPSPGPAVTLRLTRPAFGAMKDSLKADLSPGPSASAPLVKRLPLGPGTGGPDLALLETEAGFWAAWTDPQGRITVWDLDAQAVLGRPLPGTSGAALRLTLPGPTVTAGASWRWTGVDWVEAPRPAEAWVRAPGGDFRIGTGPSVWKKGGFGDTDLGLPPDRRTDRLALGATADGLYAAAGSSKEAWKALYRWSEGRGWTILAPPPGTEPAERNFWTLSTGAPRLWLVQGPRPLTLSGFDGEAWSAPLDLAPLGPGPFRAAVFLAPSARARTGRLAVVTDRLTVYDLP